SLPGSIRRLLKGFAHALGLARLVARVIKRPPDVVHFQWTVVPPLDAVAMVLIRIWSPVVLTVHDTVPFNGETPSVLQRLLWDLPCTLADRIIVHTHAGRDELRRRGVDVAKVLVIPHGPLRLREQVVAPPRSDLLAKPVTFVLFGELKRYKGIDLLIEAIATLPRDVRARARFVIAGRPRMELDPIVNRIAALQLNDTIDLHPRRFTEREMAELFARADCFLFPYRQIDASGVYFLVNSLAKWIIATKVGVFAEELDEGGRGELIPPNDVAALAGAIERAVIERPVPQLPPPGRSWVNIAQATRQAYLQARLARWPATATAELSPEERSA
ncbi:MAG TPA: glycosyltransferase, partial [Polyangia bacterium]|nr:glycosyltransferase [Polyangia bacterium]